MRYFPKLLLCFFSVALLFALALPSARADLVDDLFGLIEHLRFGRVFLFGMSFGTTVTFAALRREPRRFPRAAVQGAFAHRRFTAAERIAVIERLLAQADASYTNAYAAAAAHGVIVVAPDTSPRGEGVAGALVSDKQMKADVSEAISNIKDASVSVKSALGRVGGFRTYLKWDYKYEPVSRSSKNNFGVKIYPREGRYYYLGGANMINVKDSIRGTDYETLNTVDAQLGWEVGTFDLYRIPVRTGGEAKLILSGNEYKQPFDWSQDGKYIAFVTTVTTKGTRSDIWILPIKEGKEPFPFVQTKDNEWDPHFSPDGNWIAYCSNETGQNEIYVAPFPGPGEKVHITSSGRSAPVGGSCPRWARDGKEILYLGPDNTLWIAELKITQGDVEISSTRRAFQTFAAPYAGSYDVSHDGTKIVINSDWLNGNVPPVILVANWSEILGER